MTFGIILMGYIAILRFAGVMLFLVVALFAQGPDATVCSGAGQGNEIITEITPEVLSHLADRRLQGKASCRPIAPVSTVVTTAPLTSLLGAATDGAFEQASAQAFGSSETIGHLPAFHWDNTADPKAPPEDWFRVVTHPEQWPYSTGAARTHDSHNRYQDVMLDRDTWQPIGTREKLKSFAWDTIDPFTQFSLLATSGYSWSTKGQSYFGPGWDGFLNRYYASVADNFVGAFFGKFFFPVIFHEDPRYLAMDHGSVKARSWYAFTRAFVTRRDNGRSGINFSHLLTAMASEEISNFYYPGAHHRDLVSSGTRASIAIVSDGAYNLFTEFWPDFARRIHLSLFFQHIVRQSIKSTIDVN